MFKAIKNWFGRRPERYQPKYRPLAMDEGHPFRSPGKPRNADPVPQGDKWIAVAHRDLPDGKREEIILGILQGPHDEAMDTAQEMMVNYCFQAGFYNNSVVLGGYGLASISDEEFEDYRKRIESGK